MGRKRQTSRKDSSTWCSDWLLSYNCGIRIIWKTVFESTCTVNSIWRPIYSSCGCLVFWIYGNFACRLHPHRHGLLSTTIFIMVYTTSWSNHGRRHSSQNGNRHYSCHFSWNANACSYLWGSDNFVWPRKVNRLDIFQLVPRISIIQPFCVLLHPKGVTDCNKQKRCYKYNRNHWKCLPSSLPWKLKWSS